MGCQCSYRSCGTRLPTSTHRRTCVGATHKRSRLPAVPARNATYPPKRSPASRFTPRRRSVRLDWRCTKLEASQFLGIEPVWCPGDEGHDCKLGFALQSWREPISSSTRSGQSLISLPTPRRAALREASSGPPAKAQPSQPCRLSSHRLIERVFARRHNELAVEGLGGRRRVESPIDPSTSVRSCSERSGARRQGARRTAWRSFREPRGRHESSLRSAAQACQHR